MYKSICSLETIPALSGRSLLFVSRSGWFVQPVFLLSMPCQGTGFSVYIGGSSFPMLRSRENVWCEGSEEASVQRAHDRTKDDILKYMGRRLLYVRLTHRLPTEIYLFTQSASARTEDGQAESADDQKTPATISDRPEWDGDGLCRYENRRV